MGAGNSSKATDHALTGIADLKFEIARKTGEEPDAAVPEAAANCGLCASPYRLSYRASCVALKKRRKAFPADRSKALPADPGEARCSVVGLKPPQSAACARRLLFSSTSILSRMVTHIMQMFLMAWNTTATANIPRTRSPNPKYFQIAGRCD